jgi:hypothetical protein
LTKQTNGSTLVKLILFEKSRVWNWNSFFQSLRQESGNTLETPRFSPLVVLVPGPNRAKYSVLRVSAKNKAVSMAILHKRDEGYELNPQLHPWPPVPKAHATTDKDSLAVEVEARLDSEYRRREQRLIAGGYRDPKWRRIMLKHYGEDYEGMPARAVLRALEREGERQKLAVGDLGLSAHIASPLDPVTPGAVAGIMKKKMCVKTTFLGHLLLRTW